MSAVLVYCKWTLNQDDDDDDDDEKNMSDGRKCWRLGFSQCKFE